MLLGLNIARTAVKEPGGKKTSQKLHDFKTLSN